MVMCRKTIVIGSELPAYFVEIGNRHADGGPVLHLPAPKKGMGKNVALFPD